MNGRCKLCDCLCNCICLGFTPGQIPKLLLLTIIACQPGVLFKPILMAENDTMDVDEPQPTGKGKKENKESNKARFEVKKVGALLVVDKQLPILSE